MPLESTNLFLGHWPVVHATKLNTLSKACSKRADDSVICLVPFQACPRIFQQTLRSWFCADEKHARLVGHHSLCLAARRQSLCLIQFLSWNRCEHYSCSRMKFVANEWPPCSPTTCRVADTLAWLGNCTSPRVSGDRGDFAGHLGRWIQCAWLRGGYVDLTRYHKLLESSSYLFCVQFLV